MNTDNLDFFLFQSVQIRFYRLSMPSAESFHQQDILYTFCSRDGDTFHIKKNKAHVGEARVGQGKGKKRSKEEARRRHEEAGRKKKQEEKDAEKKNRVRIENPDQINNCHRWAVIFSGVSILTYSIDVSLEPMEIKYKWRTQGV